MGDILVGIGTFVAGEGGSGEISRRGREVIRDGHIARLHWKRARRVAIRGTCSGSFQQRELKVGVVSWGTELPWLEETGGNGKQVKRETVQQLPRGKLTFFLSQLFFVPVVQVPSLPIEKNLKGFQWVVIHGVVVDDVGDVIRQTRCMAMFGDWRQIRQPGRPLEAWNAQRIPTPTFTHLNRIFPSTPSSTAHLETTNSPHQLSK